MHSSIKPRIERTEEEKKLSKKIKKLYKRQQRQSHHLTQSNSYDGKRTPKLKFTSWWLNVPLLWPFISTGINKSYTSLRQSAVGVATSIMYERYLQRM